MSGDDMRAILGGSSPKKRPIDEDAESRRARKEPSRGGTGGARRVSHEARARGISVPFSSPLKIQGAARSRTDTTSLTVTGGVAMVD